MQTVLNGFRMVWSDRELRPYIFRPLLRAIPILLGLLILTFFVMQPVAGMILGLLGLVQWLGTALAGVLTVALWWVLLGPVFFTIAIFISAFSWESLSRKVEEKAFPHIPAPSNSLRFKESMADNMRRLPRTIGVTLLCALTGPFFFGAIAAAIAGWQSQYDFTAPAFARRGILWPMQRTHTKQLPERAQLFLAAAVCSWVPILNLFSLPALVAAGSIMVAKQEQRAADSGVPTGRMKDHAGETR